jgi:hypothetical protein
MKSSILVEQLMKKGLTRDEAIKMIREVSGVAQ